MEIIAGFSAVAIVTGLVELVKRAGLSSQLAPIAAVIFGIALSVLGTGFSSTSIVVGVVLGLASSGLWSGAKAVSGN